jgi:hypothetical protein
MTCAYCKEITVCAICGKGYAEAVRAAAAPAIPQGYKAMPIKALRKLGALIEAPWTDETAPDVLRRIHRTWDEMHAARAQGPYCAKLAGPCPDGCPTVQLTGCGGGTAGDCWRVKQPTLAGGPQ